MLSNIIWRIGKLYTINLCPVSQQRHHAHCRAALHRHVANPAKEAPQIVGAAKATQTSGASQVAQEAAENAVEASQIGLIEERDSLDPEEAAPHKAALLRSWTLDSHPEMEELLRDTPPVHSPTPEKPSPPGAARIPVEAANEPAENMEAVVNRLLTAVEVLMAFVEGWYILF